eukprot:CAMPEP_0170363018 /NCGR_PEP_ID=MMETSP0117_2-20130122/4638_1 /TAXON_ID=400756 /ORGANISM="Durinskia baltica, Strain CSIRO CS-38" /LENGTH=1545 /DNA_ID=CAMNT_0010617467 /DNA_START=31 /DNA_END=4668 /DNA_ORIENTATION=-
MMAECVGLDCVAPSLTEVCHGQCPVKKRQTMMMLEKYQMCDKYVESLVRIIDVGDIGSSMSVDSRHLAAVLLKNIVCKRGKPTVPVQPIRGQNIQHTAVRPLHTEERVALKAFLVRYQEEPSCKVALQLSLIAAKLTRQDGDQWLQEWPELMPALVSAIKATSLSPGATTASTGIAGEACGKYIDINSPQFIQSMRSVSTLNEVLTEMSSKASVASSSSSFGKTFSTLCAQLYPHIAKVWGQNMRLFQDYIGRLNTQASGTNYGSFGTSVTGVAQAELESLVVHTVLLSKVVRVFLEFGIEQICATYTTFFKSFFKCYMGGLRILADFVRNYRPFCASLRQSSDGYANCGSSKIFSGLLVCMKNQIMADEDSDDMCDAYVPLDCTRGNDSQANLVSLLNLTLKLIKSMACAPVILQRKYPLLLVPSLNCMLEYYSTFLLEEYRGMATQTCELSVLEPGVGSSVPSQLTQEQRHNMYSAQFVRDALPLNYLVKASALFLANVLSCADYAEHNIYAQQQAPLPPQSQSPLQQQQQQQGNFPSVDEYNSNSNNTSSQCACSSNMEESAEVKRDVSGALEVRKAFFTISRITQLVQLLIYPMLTYNDKELAIWAECPEEFVLSQERSCEVRSVKYSAERLFTALIEFAPDTVCALVCPMLMDCSRQEGILTPLLLPPGSVPCMQQRYFMSRELKIYDAVYVCAGLGVAYMGPFMTQLKRQCQALGQQPCCGGGPYNVDEEEGASYWVRQYLGPMIQQLLLSPTAGCILPGKQQLLRSRLVWLLSVWMDKFDRAVLPHVLNILIDFIGPARGSDVVVKMNAIQALQALINLEIFDISDLKYHVISAVEALCLFVRELEESDCKVTVLEVAGEFISLLSVQLTALKPLVEPLAGYLENLWSETVHSDPSRHAIFDVMSVLVKASKHHSASILSVTLPLIQVACTTQPSSDQCGGYCPEPGSYLRELACPLQHQQQRARRNSRSGNVGNGNGNGFLVRDGVALWLQVMRNLTEQQYAKHAVDLQQLFIMAMRGMGLSEPSASSTSSCASSSSSCYQKCSSASTQRGGRVGGWELGTDPEYAVITQDLMLILEAYALLGGEAHSLLREDPRSQSCITALYCATLGKVEPKYVQFLTRPLQAFILSTPVLAGQFLSDTCILSEILRKCMASVACPKLADLYKAHKESDVALTSYLTLVAQLLLFNPSSLLAAIVIIKVEVLNFVQATTGCADQKILPDVILVAELVNLMFAMFNTLAYSPGSAFKSKLWCLGLLSLFPPTVLDNQPMAPPGTGLATHERTQPRRKPDCAIGRAMLMLMNSMQFNIGRARLEQYQRDHCNSAGVGSGSSDSSGGVGGVQGSPAQERKVSAGVDYFSVCFWFPSILTSEQLYNWVEPVVRVCKSALRLEKSKKYRARMREELMVLVSAGSENQVGLCAVGEDSDDDCCDNDGDDDTEEGGRDGEENSSTECDVSMKATEAEEDVVMGATITAQDGDSQRLDVAEEPIALVYRARMNQSGLLSASIATHITEKVMQLRKTLGEEQFSTLQCVAELNL